MNSLKSKIDFNSVYYSNLRHEFHKIPELGLKEYKTHELLLSSLNKIPNFKEYSKLTMVGETGIFVDISGRKTSTEPPYTIVLRADMDGLPLQEKSGVEYTSLHPGKAHSCGHDGHMTILIATIEYYLKCIDKIPNTFTVRFLFQPAEETGDGSKVMIKGGCLESIDEIYGLHNSGSTSLGKIGVIEGTIMSSITLFDMTIHGKGGHSGYPYLANNPIVIANQICNSINQIMTYDISSKDQAVICITSIQAGEAYNVIPDTAIVKGSFRTLSREVREKIGNRISDICKGAELSYNAKIDVNINSDHGIETVNSKGATKVVTDIANKYFKIGNEDLPSMASEDFSFYLVKVPGCYFMIGSRDEKHIIGVHNPEFDFNDKCIEIGLEMYIRIIEVKSGTILI
jgi:amidohydrolase